MLLAVRRRGAVDKLVVDVVGALVHSVLHDARVVTELVAAHRAARRAQPDHAPLLWYGHFDWASHRTTAEGFRGTHCGVGHNPC